MPRDKTQGREPTRHVLHALEVFGTNLDDYVHLIAPVLVSLFEKLNVPLEVQFPNNILLLKDNVQLTMRSGQNPGYPNDRAVVSIVELCRSVHPFHACAMLTA